LEEVWEGVSEGEEQSPGRDNGWQVMEARENHRARMRGASCFLSLGHLNSTQIFKVKLCAFTLISSSIYQIIACLGTITHRYS